MKVSSGVWWVMKLSGRRGTLRGGEVAVGAVTAGITQKSIVLASILAERAAVGWKGRDCLLFLSEAGALGSRADTEGFKVLLCLAAWLVVLMARAILAAGAVRRGPIVVARGVVLGGVHV